MRRYLIIILLLLGVVINAQTIYYVKNGGNDLADGLNDANAWETINKVNNSSFSPGDIICFKKGDSWREMLIPVGGTSAGRITYTSYGEGDKPILYGSIVSSSLGEWTDLGSNIWQHTTTFSTYEVSNLIFNNGTSNGVRIKPGEGSPDAQGEFYFNTFSDRLTLYSVGNPHTFYSTGIEIALGRNAIHAWYADYIVIDGLSIKFTGRHGIGMVENDYVTVQNCDFFYMGGMEDYDGAGYRLGNGVEFWLHCTNILVQYNTFDQIFDAGVSPQHDCENITIRYNVFSNCCWALEISTRTVDPLTTSFHFNNNTLVKTGGYSMNQRWGVGDYACPIIVWTLYGTGTTDFSKITDIQIRNNIICETEKTLTPFGLLTWYANTTVHPEYNQNYNLFFQTLPWGNSELGCIGNGAEYFFNIHGVPDEFPQEMYDWYLGTGLDSNSFFANPLFVDYNGGDYHLAEGSPAVGAGVDLGYTRDFDGNIVSNSPSIGAYEFELGSEIVVNGAFDSVSSWNLDTGWTIGSGVLSASATNYASVAQTSSLVLDDTYQVQFDLIVTSGSVDILLGASQPVIKSKDPGKIVTSGHHLYIVHFGVTGNSNIYITPSPDFVGSIDNLSIRKVLNPNQNYFDKGKLVLSWDCDMPTVYSTVYQTLLSKNIKSTFYVPAYNLTESDWTSLQIMNSNGMDIQCHGYTHSDLTLLTNAQILTELNNVDSTFAYHSIPLPHHIAYPYGAYNSDLKNTVSVLRYTGRGVNDFTNVFLPFDKITDRYALKAAIIDNVDEINIQDLKHRLDDANRRKEAIILFGHGAGDLDHIPVTYLNEIIDYAINIGIDIITITQLYTLLNESNRVILPDPDPPSSTGGFIKSGNKFVKYNGKLLK